MPLPNEGEPISFNDLHAELGSSQGTTLTLQNAGISFGLNQDETNWGDATPGLSMSEFYGGAGVTGGGGTTTTLAPGNTTTTTTNPPSTRYYITSQESTSGSACGQTTGLLEFYLSGLSNTVNAGDIVYTGPSLTSTYVGDGLSFIGMDTDYGVFPDVAVQIDSNGEILTATNCPAGITTTTTTLAGTTTTTTLSGITGSCQFIFVEDSIEGFGTDRDRYGLQWYNPTLGTRQRTFTDFGIVPDTTYNGVNGQMFSICSTFNITRLWDSATNTTVDIPDDVVVLPAGNECYEDTDCEYSTTSTTSTSTTTTLAPIQYTAFYGHTSGLGDGSEFTACAQTTISTLLYFTSSVGTFSDFITNFGTLTNLEKTIYTDDTLTTALNGNTTWYGVDSTGPDPSYAFLINSSGVVGTVANCNVTSTTTLAPVSDTLLLYETTAGGGYTNSTDACNGTGGQSILDKYIPHNDGVQVGTYVYNDSNVTSGNEFNGGNNWYQVQASIGPDVIQIDTSGQIIDVVSCSSTSTTTTTTTTSTTTTTTATPYTAYSTTPSHANSNDTCADDIPGGGAAIVLYLEGSGTTPSNGLTVYTSAGGSTYVGDGSYIGFGSAGSKPTYAVAINSLGEITDVVTCTGSETTTTTAAPSRTSLSLGYSTLSGLDACDDYLVSPVTVYGDGANLSVSTALYTNSTGGTVAATGYYADDFGYRYWDGVTLDTYTSCTPPPEPETTTTTTSTTTTTAAPVYQSYLAERTDGLGGFIGPISQAYTLNDVVFTNDGSGLCWVIGDTGEQTTSPTYTITSLCNTTTTTLAPATTTTPPASLSGWDGSSQAASSGTACLAGGSNTYGFFGTGTYPEIGDTCYTSTAGGKFLPSGWYRDNNELAALQIGSSGVVTNKVYC